jgi:hypothetical protein
MSPVGHAAYWRLYREVKEAAVMSKVFGMHMIAIKPGVKAEDFEKFMQEEALPSFLLEGVKGYLLKGDRGDREGKYLVMYEFESVEARDRYFPSPGETSKEAQQSFEASGVFALMEKWGKFATPIDTIYTDYIEVSG